MEISTSGLEVSEPQQLLTDSAETPVVGYGESAVMSATGSLVNITPVSALKILVSDL